MEGRALRGDLHLLAGILGVENDALGESLVPVHAKLGLELEGAARDVGLVADAQGQRWAGDAQPRTLACLADWQRFQDAIGP